MCQSHTHTWRCRDSLKSLESKRHCGARSPAINCNLGQNWEKAGAHSHSLIRDFIPILLASVDFQIGGWQWFLQRIIQSPEVPLRGSKARRRGPARRSLRLRSLPSCTNCGFLLDTFVRFCQMQKSKVHVVKLSELPIPAKQLLSDHPEFKAASRVIGISRRLEGVGPDWTQTPSPVPTSIRSDSFLPVVQMIAIGMRQISMHAFWVLFLSH